MIVIFLWRDAKSVSLKCFVNLWQSGVVKIKIENGKIIRATESELFALYLDREMDDVISFTEYVVRMQQAGCEVIVGEDKEADF